MPGSCRRRAPSCLCAPCRRCRPNRSRRPCPGACSGGSRPLLDEWLQVACLLALTNVLHLDEVADLEDHAPNLGRVIVLDGVVQMPETQREHRRSLVLLTTAEAPHLPDSNLTRHEHLHDPTARPRGSRAR